MLRFGEYAYTRGLRTRGMALPLFYETHYQFNFYILWFTKISQTLTIQALIPSGFFQ